MEKFTKLAGNELKKARKNAKKLLEESEFECCLVATNNGVSICGTPFQMMAIVCSVVDTMIENKGIPKNVAKGILQDYIDGIGKKKKVEDKDLEKLIKTKEMLDEMMKMIKDM